MTSLSPEGRRSRLLHIFERTGGPGLMTNAFNLLPTPVTSVINSNVSFGPKELPVLAFFDNEEHWLLLTSEQLISKENGITSQIRWEEITDATIDRDELRATALLPNKGKLAIKQLHIILRSGDRLPLNLEAGPSLIGVWNVFKAIGSMGSQHRKSRAG